MPRIITEDELRTESRQKTCRCSGCKLWIRFLTEEVITDVPGDRRYLICPGCGYERILALGLSDRDKELASNLP